MADGLALRASIVVQPIDSQAAIENNG